MSDDKMEFEGTIVEALPGSEFKVELANINKIVKCRPSGKIRLNKIKMYVGDKVTVKISTYNLDLGTITFRHRS